MRVIGIIPARGGSKGIPRKNLQPIGDSTLVGLKIRQGNESLCTEVWVSTEDLEISDVSKKFGAQIITRPNSLSTDEASTDALLLHAIEFLNCSDQDILVLLQPTSPLIKISSINSCIGKLIENPELNSVISVREAHPFMWTTKDDRSWDPVGHARNLRPRRQELARGGWETGGCYAIKVSALREQLVRYPEPTGVFEVSYLEALDVDNFEDLASARTVFSRE